MKNAIVILLLSLPLLAVNAAASTVKFGAPDFVRDSVRNKHKIENNPKQQGGWSDFKTGSSRNPFGPHSYRQDHDQDRHPVLDEYPGNEYSLTHRGSDRLPRDFNFDELKRRDRDKHHGDDFPWDSKFHDREQDYFGDKYENWNCSKTDTNPVPLPAAAWLFMSGLAGLMRVSHRRKK